MKSFKTFIKEKATKTLVTTFGRFNPPHVGHAVNFKELAAAAKKEKADYRIYSSQSQDAKKNPLGYEEKIKFLRKLFPQHARSIYLDKKVKNPFDVAKQAYADGYEKLVIAVGPDRANEFRDMLLKYNKEGGIFYFPEGIEVIDTGKGVRISSATLMRKSAENNDLTTFAKNLPKTFKEVEKLFNAVRKGMGLKESTNFRKHININPNQVREQFFNKEIFNEDDTVISIKDNKTYKIKERFSNYVSAIHDDTIKKFFITDIIPINENP
jgi:hypothetical protein